MYEQKCTSENTIVNKRSQVKTNNDEQNRLSEQKLTHKTAK